jgi:hypothetical protein
MTKLKALLAAVSLFVVALGLTSFVTGCGSIRTEIPAQLSNARLSPNPPKILVARFNTDTARWLTNRHGDGNEYSQLSDFKKEFQNKFQQILIERLQKVAPASQVWLDDIPNEGWLVTGDFITVDQGSRLLRTVPGFGAGETTLQTKVYVYDLSQSKTHYVLSFDTGIPEKKKSAGAGSGEGPPGDVVSGLTMDSERTAREIRNILMTYR